MPVKLSTTISNISSITNSANSPVVYEFSQYMKSIGTSENYQNGNLKIIIYFAKFLGPTTDFYNIQKKEQILAFLDTRIKDTEIDPDKRWIRTWNDYLPEYALKKKVRWSMNSKQGSRYIKRRMGNDLKQKILVQNGIISEQQVERKPSIINCPRCSLVNAIENKYCSKCSYPLVPSAFEEIKEAENRRIQEIQQKYEQDMKSMREEIREDMKYQLAQLISRLKPEIVKEGLV